MRRVEAPKLDTRGWIKAHHEDGLPLHRWRFGKTFLEAEPLAKGKFIPARVNPNQRRLSERPRD